MQQLSQPQATRDPKFYDERPNAFAPIEIIILCRINQIKSSDPADHARSKHQWRKIDMSGLRNPSADRRNCQRQSEKEMGRAREPLRERIEKNHGQSNRREHQRQSIDRRRCENKSSGTESQQNEG